MTTIKRKRTILAEMVTRRARDTAALLASIRIHKAQVAAALGERFTPALRQGETVPDLELTLELAGRSVELAFDRLDQLDDRHFLAKADRAHLARELAHVAKQELYPEAVAVRRQIDAAFGREAGSDLHTFTGKTPRTPARLQKHIERAVARLANPNRVLPPKTVAGEPVDREGWRRRLDGPLRALAVVDDHLTRRKVELAALSGQRKQAMQHYDAVYAEAFRLVEAAFLMAGIGDRMVKSLRSYTERRRLARWARKKRAARDAAPAAVGEGEAPARRPSLGAVAAVSGWLKRRWSLG